MCCVISEAPDVQKTDRSTLMENKPQPHSLDTISLKTHSGVRLDLAKFTLPCA